MYEEKNTTMEIEQLVLKTGKSVISNYCKLCNAWHIQKEINKEDNKWYDTK